MNNSNAYRNAQQNMVPSSSVNVKREEPAPEPIVVSKVSKKKKTFGMKMRELFVKEDAKSVSQYIFGDILIPAFTNTILDMIKNGAEMMFLGRTRGPSYYGDRSGNRRIRYENYYDRDQDYYGRRPQYSGPITTPTYSYDEIVFESRGDAEAVLIDLKKQIRDVGYVTIPYLYGIIGWRSDWTAPRYGWTNLDGPNSDYIVMSGGGYWLRLPRPVAI